MNYADTNVHADEKAPAVVAEGKGRRRAAKVALAVVIALVLTAVVGGLSAIAGEGGGTGGGDGGESVGNINWTYIWDDDASAGMAGDNYNPINGDEQDSLNAFYAKMKSKMGGLPLDGTNNGYPGYVTAANSALNRARTRSINEAVARGMDRAEAERICKARVVGVGWTWSPHPEFNQAWGVYYVIDNGEHGSGPWGSWGIYADTKLNYASANGLRDGGSGEQTSYSGIREGDTKPYREIVWDRARSDVGHRMSDVFTVVAVTNLDFDMTGWLQLKKSTEGNPAWAKDNRMYSLEGAKYAVYKSRADAQSDRNRVQLKLESGSKVSVLTTDATGTSAKGELDQGTYYVKEVASSPGHYLDEAIYEVAVKTSHTKEKPYVLSVTDKPAYGPGISVLKIDSALQRPLAGAVYQVSYYDVASGSDFSNQIAKRTWYIQTKDAPGNNPTDGMAFLKANYLFNNDTLTSDPLWTVGSEAIIPLGTVTVKEVIPPPGYWLDNGIVGQQPDTFVNRRTLPANTLVSKYNTEGRGVVETKVAPSYYVNGTDSLGRPAPDGIVVTATSPTAGNVAERGDLKIVKRDADVWAFYVGEGWEYADGNTWVGEPNDPQGNATLKGAVFHVINATTNEHGESTSVIGPDGRTYGPGEVVCILTTNEDGECATNDPATMDRQVTVDNKRAGGALTTGTYTVKEVTAPKGYLPNPSWTGWGKVEFQKTITVKPRS